MMKNSLQNLPPNEEKLSLDLFNIILSYTYEKKCQHSLYHYLNRLFEITLTRRHEFEI